jgi:hypothetical protein
MTISTTAFDIIRTGINVKEKGLLGDDTANDATLLNTLITAIGSTKTDLYIPSGTYKIATNVVFPSNVRLIMGYGAILKVSNTYSITGTNTKLEAALYQIFDLSLGGTIVGTWDIKEVYPEWFGDSVDFSVDFATAMGGGKIRLSPNKEYSLSTPQTLTTKTSIEGSGYSSKIKWTGADGTDYMFSIPVTGGQYSSIRNLWLEGDYKCKGVYDGLNQAGFTSTRLLMENVKMFHHKTALTVNGAGSEFKNLYIFGEPTTDNATGRCLTGIELIKTDNFFSDIRVLGFKTYGLNCTSSSNRFKNVKLAVNGIGARFYNCDNIQANIDVQENYEDNIVFDTCRSSNFIVNSHGAGCIEREEGSSTPEVLTSYNLMKFVNSSNLFIVGSLLGKTSFSDRWSNEGNYVSIDGGCSAIDLNMTARTGFYTMVQPTIFSGINDKTNSFRFNGMQYDNELTPFALPAFTKASKTEIIVTDDDINVTITPVGGDDEETPMALFYFTDADFTQDRMLYHFSIDKMVTDITLYYQYAADGSIRSINAPNNVFYSVGGRMYFSVVIPSITSFLAGSAQWVSDIGKIITNQRFYIKVTGVLSANNNLVLNVNDIKLWY